MKTPPDRKLGCHLFSLKVSGHLSGHFSGHLSGHLSGRLPAPFRAAFPGHFSGAPAPAPFSGHLSPGPFRIITPGLLAGNIPWGQYDSKPDRKRELVSTMSIVHRCKRLNFDDPCGASWRNMLTYYQPELSMNEACVHLLLHMLMAPVGIIPVPTIVAQMWAIHARPFFTAFK